MKSKLLKIKGLAVILMAFTACSPDEIEPMSGKIQCNIDGEYWESSDEGAVVGNGVTNITGQIPGTGETITMTIQSEATGSYALTAGGTHAAIYVESSSSSSSYASNTSGGSGSVVITVINATTMKISGNFNFVGTQPSTGNSIEITDGVFTDIPYVEEVEETFDNTFACKINGSNYVPTLIAGSTYFGSISITASQSGGNISVGLSMPDDVTPGTYSMSPFGSYKGLYNLSSSVDDQYSGNPGSLTISSHNTTDKIVEGTFSFTAMPNPGSAATDSHDVTEGSFSVSY